MRRRGTRWSRQRSVPRRAAPAAEQIASVSVAASAPAGIAASAGKCVAEVPEDATAAEAKKAVKGMNQAAEVAAGSNAEAKTAPEVRRLVL